MPPPLGFGYWLPISGEGGMGIIGPPVSFLIRLRGGRVPGAPRNLTICITIFHELNLNFRKILIGGRQTDSMKRRQAN